MKEIKVEVTKYVADDGTRFDDRESCEKHDVECMAVSDACANRIAMIQAKRKKIDDENEEYERKQTQQLEEMLDKIRSMKSRIESLIKIGNELSKSGFEYGEWFYGTRRVGFARTYYDGECQKLCIGVAVRKGDCCYLEFKTNGERMIGIRDIDFSEKIYVVSYFLDDFDRFEKKFYEWLDENMK